MKFFLSIFVILMICKCNENKSNTWKFSNAIEPVVYDIEKDSIKDKKTNEILKDSKACSSCHKLIYDNWEKSRHKVSLTNQLYKESHSKEPQIWCVNCHAPLWNPKSDLKDPEQRVLKEEGINCQVCHVREAKIITGKLPILKENNSYSHDYKVDPKLKSSEFCGNCHQFSFPKIHTLGDSVKIHYTNLAMQNTNEEFKNTQMSKYGNCQDCHLQSQTGESHSFFGGHDKDKLKNSLFFSLVRIGKTNFILEVYSYGIAHSFPTGDLFRNLRIRIKNKEKKIITELQLKKVYQEINGNYFLVSDTVIPEPSKSEIASRIQFPFQLNNNLKEIYVEMILDFLNPSSRIFTKIPFDETFLKIKEEKILIPKFDGNEG
ncbi:MAG: multiheme c-type cytochrome [Leptospiraceae bacterium]|nr:multiheme c-type cytochrome [Leptospiraceae bacterium]